METRTAKIKQLRDKYKNAQGTVVEETVYPVTRSDAVYMSNAYNTVEQAINDLYDGDSTIEFNDDGTITTTLASERVVTTTFLSNGNIQEKCVDKDNNPVYTKTTKFNDDGSISTEIDWGE